MSNNAIGEFELTAGGVAYRFKVGVAALILTQEQIGKETGTVPTFDELVLELRRHRLLYVRAILWAGLRKYHGDISLEGVNDLLDTCDPKEVVALVLGIGGSTQPDARDLAALEAAGARPTAAAAATTPRRPANATKIRAPGHARSTSRRARPG